MAYDLNEQKRLINLLMDRLDGLVRERQDLLRRPPAGMSPIQRRYKQIELENAAHEVSRRLFTKREESLGRVVAYWRF